MKLLTLFILIVLILAAASLPVDGGRCPGKKHCVPTPTPVITPQLVFYQAFQVQALWDGTRYICRLYGTQTWFPCRAYALKTPQGRTLYGFIRV